VCLGIAKRLEMVVCVMMFLACHLLPLQVFEITAGVLCRDKYSILAALCRSKDPPLTKTQQRYFFLERDWLVLPASPFHHQYYYSNNK